MTKQELYITWVRQEYDIKNIDAEAFYKALDEYYDARILVEALEFLNNV